MGERSRPLNGQKILQETRNNSHKDPRKSRKDPRKRFPFERIFVQGHPQGFAVLLQTFPQERVPECLAASREADKMMEKNGIYEVLQNTSIT